MSEDKITGLDRILKPAKAALHTYLASRKYDLIGHRSIKHAFREFGYERKTIKELAGLVKRVQGQSGFSATGLTDIQIGDVIAYTERGNPTTFLGIVTDRRGFFDSTVDTYSVFVLSETDPESGETRQTSARHTVAVPYSRYDKGQVVVGTYWKGPTLEHAVRLPHSTLRTVPRDVMEKVDFAPPLKKAILERVYR